ncbi:MAG: HAD family hydrolase [Treponema sp.]|nr:HAD family hydrolase [Treponema sp.]
MNCKAVIFDLDGTLLNTLDDIAESCNFALSAFNFPLRTVDEVRQFVGNGYSRLIELAVPGGKENPLFQQVLQKGKDFYSKNCQNKTAPYDGIPELMEKLSKEGIKLGIVSNKPDNEVKTLAKRYFNSYVTKETAVGEMEDKGIRRKPFPDSVNKLISILGVNKEEALYVGDSDVDVLTAKNAGIKCISVTWGFRTRDFLEKNGALYFADSPAQLFQMICSTSW